MPRTIQEGKGMSGEMLLITTAQMYCKFCLHQAAQCLHGSFSGSESYN